MHTEMWEHPATQANVATLRARGALVIEPAEGRLTGADTGKGRLPEPGGDLRGLPSTCWPAASRPPDLAGRHVVVSAGGTREYLDPVRFLGNRSSGLQGYALARAAAARGAEVTLVAANVDPARPGRRQGRAGRDHRRSCATRCVAAAADADAVVMAAAPADFRPASTSARPRSRRPTTAPRPTHRAGPEPRHPRRDLARTAPAPGSVVVGFAAETGDDTGSVLDLARAKLARKGCDLLVVNDVSGGAVFGSPDNEAVILGADGGAVEVPRGSKTALAHVDLGPGGRPASDVTLARRFVVLR